MSQTIILEHKITEFVRVPSLDLNARVIAVFIGDTGIQYKVHYVLNGEFHDVYLYPDDIEKVK
jgi:hypothetical protein